MAHFAKLDDNNVVLEVHVVNNEVLDKNDEEGSGIAFLIEWSQGHTNWKQTSYSAKMRYNFAGVGYIYDPVDDAFIPPMPECGHDNLELNANKQWTCSDCENIKYENLAK